MILYIIQGGIDMTDELQGIVNRIAATNYTNKKKRPVLCYITQNRAIKKKRIFQGSAAPAVYTGTAICERSPEHYYYSMTLLHLSREGKVSMKCKKCRKEIPDGSKSCHLDHNRTFGCGFIFLA